MNAFGRVTLARQRAEGLVAELGIPGPRVDPFAIARDHDIVVQAKPPGGDKGVSGMLLRHGDSFGILYADDERGPGFQRFSVAHELGHYFLDGHCDQLLGAGYHASRAGQGATDPHEREADAFASALLMPRAFLAPLLRAHDAGLELIQQVADTFEASLTASGLRLTETCRDPIALILSHAGTIEICAMSEAFKPHARRGWLRKGDPVPAGSPTAVLAANGPRVWEAERSDARIDIASWYDCEKATPGREEVLGLGAWGRVLTVLTCAGVDEPDDDDTESEEEIVERWTPRFR